MTPQARELIPNLTQAHEFLIEHGAEPDTLLDQLDETLVDRHFDFDNGTLSWYFPDGSVIEVSKTNDVDLRLHPANGGCSR